jgi:DNA-directed RNA polymerase specialized sigma24 family protein
LQAAPPPTAPGTALTPADPAHAAVRLFDACAPELFALALAVSGDADAAEDAVFDAFSAAMDLSTLPTRAGLAMRVRTAALSRRASRRGGGESSADAERCAVDLACYARLTVPEIAVELGIPPAEVKRRLAAGLRSVGRVPAGMGG